MGFTAKLFRLFIYTKWRGHLPKLLQGNKIRHRRMLAKDILMNTSWRYCNKPNILIIVIILKEVLSWNCFTITVFYLDMFVITRHVTFSK